MFDMKKIILIMSLFLTGIIFFKTETVMAKDNEEDKVGFYIQSETSSNQLDNSASYFYVRTKPGEKQTLKVSVVSTRKEPVTIIPVLQDAYSSPYGSIIYSNEDDVMFNRDETMKNSITDIVKMPTQEITVANEEVKVVELEIDPPKEHYDGVKMGRIEFVTKTDDKETISSPIAYNIGIILAEDGSDFIDSRSLNLVDVKAELWEGKKAVVAKFQNPEPKLIENLTIRTKIKDEKSQKIIKERAVKGFAMAPNSEMQFVLDWGLVKLPAGNFIFEATAESEFENWEFSQKFTITDRQAKDINTESAFTIITPKWVKAFAVVNGVVVAIIVALLFIRRKKMTESFNKMKRRTKKNHSRKKKLNSRRGEK